MFDATRKFTVSLPSYDGGGDGEGIGGDGVGGGVGDGSASINT